jgi:dephospho-CoA kinase
VTLRVPVIGIVGGIGSGKSTVAELMGRMGCAVIDADRIGHELLELPDVRDALKAIWGPRILDDQGRVSRTALGKIVFGDGRELARLNAIMHPRIGTEIARRIEDLRARGQLRAIVLDAAVLFEAGWDRFCDRIVLVKASQEIRDKRVKENRGWDPSRRRQREKMQISIDTKAASCSDEIDNSSSIAHLQKRVEELLGRIAPQ